MGYEDRPQPGPDDRRPSRRRRRPLRALAAVVGGVALLGVLAMAGYLIYLQRTVEGNIEHADLRPPQNARITISPDVDSARQPSDASAPTGDASGGEAGEEDGATGEDGGTGDGGATGGDGDGDGGDGTGQGGEDEEVAPIVGPDGEPISVGGTEVVVSNPQPSPSAGDALNFLVIGTDSRDLSVERGRSDVIVLMHINDARDRVDLVHFPRDLFVPIAGTGGSSKINAAYAYGGAPLLVQTLQPLIGVPVDHVVIVNFESFKAMTDAIGGVDVMVTEAGGGFSTGMHHMNGEQGLRFVRERYSLSQGDISRGERQMQFIKGIMNKALSRETLTNPARVAGFVDAATTNLTVDADLRVSEMRDLGLSMRGVRGDDIHFWQGPWNGIDMHPVAGSIVLMADEQMARLGQHLQNDSMGSYVDNVSPRSGFGG